MAGPDGEIIASCGPEEGILTVDVEKKWMVARHGEKGTHDVRWVMSRHRRPDVYRKEDVR